MRKVRNLVLVILLAGLLVVPVAAQEATETPTPEPTLVVEDTPIAVPPASEVVQMSWQGLAALVGILLAGGFTVGIGGALVFVRAVRQNDVVKDAMEKLYLSTPPGTQEQVRKMVELLLESGTLLDEVTDGKQD